MIVITLNQLNDTDVFVQIKHTRLRLHCKQEENQKDYHVFIERIKHPHIKHMSHYDLMQINE